MQEVQALFVQMIKRYSTEFRRQIDGDLTGPQIYLLEILVEGPMKMSDLAERLQVTVGAVTLQADRSIKAGLITRERSTTDRRVVLLSITDQGQAIVKKMREVRRNILQELFGRLNSEEAEQLGVLYRKMLREE